MIILGLTGSIATGKSTIAGFFADEGIPVSDADAAVHELMEKGGGAFAAIAAEFPDAVADNGIDRKKLGKIVFADPPKKKILEGILHPLVRAKRDLWLDEHRRGKAEMVVLDIPLLFETGGEAICDAVVVVTTTPEIQKSRACAREGMTEALFEAILASQMSDAEKRGRADYLIDTSGSMDESRGAVRGVIEQVRHARNHS